MKKFKFICPAVILLTVVFSGAFIKNVSADESGGNFAKPVKMALGFNIDLLPVVMSATQKEFGFAGQTWVGIDHIALRLVAAHMHMPDVFAAKNGFTGMETSVAAVIIDYFFGDNFDGWWIGTGVEVWQSNIGHKDAPNERAQFVNLVWTLGGGYVWRFWGNFYLNPWAAVHVITNARTIKIAEKELSQFPLMGEASLKIGFYFDL